MTMHKCTEAELRVCSTLLFPYQFSGIGFTLNGVSYTNNSIVTITEIGTGSAALLCIILHMKKQSAVFLLMEV